MFKLDQLEQAVSKFITRDMMKKMLNQKRNNQRWEAPTVAYCYKLLAKLGASGYEFLTSLNWPLVSLRTLRERTSAIRFLPGPQDEIMDALGTKVAHDTVGSLAVMSVDEMAIKYFSPFFFSLLS